MRSHYKTSHWKTNTNLMKDQSLSEEKSKKTQHCERLKMHTHTHYGILQRAYVSRKQFVNIHHKS